MALLHGSPLHIAPAALALMFLAWCGGYIVARLADRLAVSDGRMAAMWFAVAFGLFCVCLFILDRISEVLLAGTT